MDWRNKTVVITGGTDGIGAAVALEVHRRGAHVWIIGRSAEKGNRLQATATAHGGGGTFVFLPADFSHMTQVRETVAQLRRDGVSIDVLIHCVGILIAHTEYTAEGVEKDFAVGYLSRFVMTQALVTEQMLHPGSVMVNVAASGPRIPRMARLEFPDLPTVMERVGMQSHGQAQLANDLFSQEAARRWGLAVIGYGPGSVATNIRRELPAVLMRLIQPFFAFSTRQPQEVGRQVVSIIEEQRPPPGEAWFFHKHGRFTPHPFVTDMQRRQSLWQISTALAERTLGAGV